MLKIHTSDGKTHRIDLHDAEQAKGLMALMRKRDFQATITGVSVVGEAPARLRCPSCGRAGKLSCSGCHSDVPADAKLITGVQYSLTRPDDYQGPVTFIVEDVPTAAGTRARGGERVSCFVGDTRVQMMVHRGQPSVRVSLLRVGHQRYTPDID